ncbi:MAG: hypothetical protein C0391_00955 [Anaerolinea sp.]|nr:hypothetical protein [Anaerolinea sp.]
MGSVEQGISIIQANGIGSLAAETLTHTHRYSVRGNTSKGLFIEGLGETLIFLSYERFCGPFTVNLPNDAAGLMADIQPGEVIIGTDSCALAIDSIQLRIATSGIHPWIPAPYIKKVTNKVIANNTTRLAQWAGDNIPTNSLLSITSALLTGNVNTEMSNKFMRYLKDLESAIRSKDQDNFLLSASLLVGLGNGLTPSGDDLLTGINLAVNRYSRLFPRLSFYLPWMRELEQVIRTRTTMISSALFQAAFQGFADERLIDAFDEMMSDDMHLDRVIGPLSAWGSSSGFDSLAGILLILSVINSESNIADLQ